MPYTVEGREIYDLSKAFFREKPRKVGSLNWWISETRLDDRQLAELLGLTYDECGEYEIRRIR